MKFNRKGRFDWNGFDCTAFSGSGDLKKFIDTDCLTGIIHVTNINGQSYNTTSICDVTSLCDIEDYIDVSKYNFEMLSKAFEFGHWVLTISKKDKE